MTTTGVNNSTSGGSQIQNKNMQLKAEDFIKMMVTQLQNQDPLEPAKNGELLAQMSQIGQLQTSTTLQESFKSLMMQSQIGSAGNLIGKTVRGMDDKNATIDGVVTSVRVSGSSVYLELDNGSSLDMTRVTNIAGAPTSTTTKLAG